MPFIIGIGVCVECDALKLIVSSSGITYEKPFELGKGMCSDCLEKHVKAMML